MNQHRYILEPYKGLKTRYPCPYCGANRKFVRYIDTETGQHLADHVGKCERVNNCGKHFTPKEFFNETKPLIPSLPGKLNHKQITTPTLKEKPVSFIPVELFKQSLQVDKDYSEKVESNKFLRFLNHLFGFELTCKLTSKYFISSSTQWTGANVFWQVDIKGKVRTGKIMLYDTVTGKRIKKPYDHITWVHKKINQPEFELKQCFFGEHLLHNKTKPVAIVESEKTAIIASVYLPRFIWLATGGLENLNPDKCKPLAGRTVVLFPDLRAFDIWSSKAVKLEKSLPGTKFIISDLLEKKSVEADKTKGYDLADYLIKFDWKQFISQDKQTRPKPKTIPNGGIFQNPVFQEMANKNPAIIKLVEAFDLKMEIIEEGSQNDPIIPSKEVFSELALTTIGNFNHLHQNLIPYFAQMLEHGIIVQAEPLVGFYYLSESTPF